MTSRARGRLSSTLSLAALAAAIAATGLTSCASGRCCDPGARPAMPMPVVTRPGGAADGGASLAPGATAPKTASAASIAEPLPAPGTILEQRTGKSIEFDALIVRLTDPGAPSVVYVGEGHDQADHHAFQAKVLDGIASHSRGPVALGMEMFFRPYQAHLDAYVAGEIDEKTMLERTEWKTRWGFGWEMYAPMLRFCRERKVPVIALNAPKEITRAVSQKGLEGLSDEQRAALPALDMTDAAHRAFVRRAFEGHGPGMKPEVFERFYTSMVIWDEVMSSSAADWLEKAGPEARMVVVAGNGHIADRYGIPARAARKSKRPYATIVQEILHAKGDDPSDWRHDTTYADYTAWWKESAPPEKPKTPAAAPTAPAKP